MRELDSPSHSTSDGAINEMKLKNQDLSSGHLYDTREAGPDCIRRSPDGILFSDLLTGFYAPVCRLDFNAGLLTGSVVFSRCR